jgi:hypothetical protein
MNTGGIHEQVCTEYSKFNNLKYEACLNNIYKFSSNLTEGTTSQLQ